MVKERLARGVDLIRINFGIERDTYEKLMRLKIVEGDKSSFTKYLNKKLAQEITRNKALLDGYEVDYSDF